MKALGVAMVLGCIACGGATARSESEFQPVEMTIAPPARATPQPIEPSADGSLTVYPGFEPDPVTLVGGVVRWGSSVPNPDCPGLYPTEPDHILVVSEPMDNVRIVVDGGHQSHDATLRILGPDDHEYCNDDVENLDPAITLSPALGSYRIWVGTFGNDAFAYILGVSASPDFMPSGISGSSLPSAPIDMGTTSNFGTIRLSPSFTPDPHVVLATAGVVEGQESHEASRWNNTCAGGVTPAPSHLFVAEQDFADLAIMARSPGDVTLVIQRPDGSLWCNDDFEGLNPLVRGPMPQGTYKIWVGTFGGTAPYTLGITENTATMPSTLP